MAMVPYRPRSRSSNSDEPVPRPVATRTDFKCNNISISVVSCNSNAKLNTKCPPPRPEKIALRNHSKKLAGKLWEAELLVPLVCPNLNQDAFDSTTCVRRSRLTK